MSALNEQVGGDHYKDMPIGPTEFCQINKINACESSIIQYMCRHHRKGGVQDLRKARHLIDMIIELEYPEEKPDPEKDIPAKKVTYSDFCSKLLADVAEKLGVDKEHLAEEHWFDPIHKEWYPRYENDKEATAFINKNLAPERVDPRIDPSEGITTRSQILKDHDMEGIDEERKAELSQNLEELHQGARRLVAENIIGKRHIKRFTTPHCPHVKDLAAAMNLKPVDVATAINAIVHSMPVSAYDAAKQALAPYCSAVSAGLILDVIKVGGIPGVTWNGSQRN
jgi:hypothetical protein